MTYQIATIEATTLHARLIGDEEIAVVDVREQGLFGQGHLLLASNLPLGHLEIRAAALIPRRSTSVVVCDGGEGTATQAAEILSRHGYTQISVLSGGVPAWEKTGFELFSGINVLSKVFGEYVEHRFDTPRVEAAVLKSRIEAGEDIVVLDSRPLDEFRVMCIPGGIDTPGAELVYRVRDLAPDSHTTVVVNCAGRTRSIIGCQSLINAGVPNPVTALKDGTMGWHLAGLDLERGAQRRAGPASAVAHDWARDAAAEVARRYRVKTITGRQLSEWRAEGDARSLYVFDVRQPQEYEAGHLPGARHAAGGQLVQATDMYIALRNARVVLVDDCDVRAKMTASWLNQMGMPAVYVLASGWQHNELETGPEPVAVLGGLPVINWMDASRLETSTDTVVIDLARSLPYRAGHVPGAFWASRGSVARWGKQLPNASHYVVSADQDELTALCVADLSKLTSTRVSGLTGGTSAWRDAGFTLETGLERTLLPPEDAYHRPYDRKKGKEQAMQDYLAWEVALVDQMKREDTVEFPVFD